MHVPLEVLDPGSPGVDEALLRLVASLPDRGPAIVLGTASDVERVASVGLEVAARVSTPRDHPRTWTRPLARCLDGIDHATLRTWSEPGLAATLPLVAGADRLAAMVAAVGPRPPAIEPWLRHRIPVRPLGFDLGPRLARRGWRVGRPIALDDLPGDGVVHGEPSIRHRCDGRLSVSMGLEPGEAMDAWTLVSAVASVAVSGRAVDLLMPAASTRWKEIGRFLVDMVPASTSARIRMRVDDRAGLVDRCTPLVDAVVMAVRPERVGETSLVTVRSWLAAGVPVIGPATRGLAALVEDGVDGRLVTPGDRNALARALLRLADDPALREDMSHAAAARHGVRRGVRRGVRSGAGLREPSPDQAGGSDAMNASAASR